MAAPARREAAAVLRDGRGSQHRARARLPGPDGGSGRPPGRPRIATRLVRPGVIAEPPAAAVLRDGRGSHTWAARITYSARAQRPSSGTAEDRNCAVVPGDIKGEYAAAVLRDGRGSQLGGSTDSAQTREGSGRPPGRPRIATSTSATGTPARRASSGRPPGGRGSQHRCPVRGAVLSRRQRPSSGAAEDRNVDQGWVLGDPALAAAVLRVGRGSQPVRRVAHQRTKPKAAAVLRGGRGSQHAGRGRHVGVAVPQRPSSGRSRIATTTAWSWSTAAASSGHPPGRSRIATRSRAPTSARGERSGRPPGRPRIATPTGWWTRTEPRSSGRPPERPRITTTSTRCGGRLMRSQRSASLTRSAKRPAGWESSGGR